MDPCNCRICLRSHRFKEALEKVPDQEKQFFRDLFSDLYSVEMDRDYYRAIVEGSWPTADEIIRKHRERKL